MSVFRPGLFAGKVAIVTGGATGIGRAISEELLSLGCRVVIASRKKERLEEAVKEMDPSGKSLEAIQCNIRREDEVQNLFTKTLSRFGHLDFLVNNGGGQFPSPLADVTLKGWEAVIQTNLTGTFLMCREAYRTWFQENGGNIVNIIADMYRGFPMMAHTGAARAGVENLTRSLAIEWAASGVRVNAVCPGSSIYSKTARENYGENDVFETVRPFVPAKRLGTPQEVSSAVCFLLSPGAAFISGATLRVDAGGSLYSNLMWNIPEHDRIPPYEWKYKPPQEGENEGDSGKPKSKL
ncbi:unnamed protein product [Darwinula stevensoni]|uniref:Peroxisomal trans-2-enoyl-CoA reductase n=1 Tax=Darwinula stevensoni TaxID=69355 RepID=A0A7R9A8Y3_9CRUS|nr:unnamed protein product [Darwinula stevensoni]CAG0896907.1 unnamed protein product [Darwinula stevensoni]